MNPLSFKRTFVVLIFFLKEKNLIIFVILKNVLTLQDLKHDSPLFLLRRSDNIIELKFYCKKLFYNLVDEVTK